MSKLNNQNSQNNQTHNNMIPDTEKMIKNYKEHQNEIKKADTLKLIGNSGLFLGGVALVSAFMITGIPTIIFGLSVATLIVSAVIKQKGVEINSKVTESLSPDIPMINISKNYKGKSNKITNTKLLNQEQITQLKQEQITQPKQEQITQLKQEQITQLKQEQITQLKQEQITQLKQEQITQLKQEQITQLKQEQLNLKATYLEYLDSKDSSKVEQAPSPNKKESSKELLEIAYKEFCDAAKEEFLRNIAIAYVKGSERYVLFKTPFVEFRTLFAERDVNGNYWSDMSLENLYSLQVSHKVVFDALFEKRDVNLTYSSGYPPEKINSLETLINYLNFMEERFVPPKKDDFASLLEQNSLNEKINQILFGKEYAEDYEKRYKIFLEANPKLQEDKSLTDYVARGLFNISLQPSEKLNESGKIPLLNKTLSTKGFKK
ncbi:MAG: hypothetical protein K9G11_02135 [Rickettsiaceae bacterium]|nr:hypothetical protein [Rickettsiaceae bacterium]